MLFDSEVIKKDVMLRTYSIVFLTSSRSSSISRPNTLVVPSDEPKRPVIIDIVVVLPAPLCPSRAKI